MIPNKPLRDPHFLPFHVILSLFIISCCSISSTTTSEIISNNGTGIVDDSELSALLTWKASLDIQSQGILASWHPNNTPCGGNWSGISCNGAGRVAGINLDSYGLGGTLHDFNFSSFTHLMNFSLANNSLHGTIPSNISVLSELVLLILEVNYFSGTIPKEIFNLTSMQFLELSENNLTGTITASIGSLIELTYLGLAKNKFFGFIPSSIGNLMKLETLVLWENQISGSIPHSIGNLTSLVDLELHQNKLSGLIPSSIGNLVKLETLYLFENELSGSIPDTISRLTSLVYLSLLSNHLSGEIPLQFNKLINLQSLQFGYNNLTGSLPDNLCVDGQLTRISANNNKLTGRLPKSFKNCTTLSRVRLEMNQLTGDLSEDLGIYPHLDFIDLSHNKFYGKLSRNWGQCKSLTSLRISNNKISGELPENLGEASRIRRLDLGSNKLVGGIPKRLGNLSSLFYLKLDGNNFFGVIPKEIQMLSMLSFLNLAANNLSGIVPEEIGELRQLRNLNLSYNKFDGNIPSQIGNILPLENLDISCNKFSGEIPQDLAQLRSLESVNLSHNYLSGLIPSNLENWASLTSVDISNNLLEGPLPDVPGFQNASFDSLKNNKGLCGDTNGLNPCFSIKSNETQRKKGYKMVILITVLVGSFFIIFVFGLYFSTRKCRKSRSIKYLAHQMEDVLSIWSFDGKLVYEDIIEATEDFDAQHCIGQGGYGSVYRAELSTGQVVAVKRLHSSEGLSMSQIEKSFMSEICALIELRHRNIVRLLGFCLHVRNPFLVYKFVDGDNLLNILKNHKQVKNFKWSHRLNVVKGVADALSYMHHEVSPPLVHRDISSKNILLDENLEAQVTDFGTARFLSQNSSYWTSFAGTVGYSAPELAYTQEITPKCDVYSFGVLTLEMVMGTHPGDLLSLLLPSSSTFGSEILLKDIIDQRVAPPVMDEMDKVILITKLAFECLKQNPQSRPTMQNVSSQLAKRKPNNAEISFSSINIGELFV